MGNIFLELQPGLIGLLAAALLAAAGVVLRRSLQRRAAAAELRQAAGGAENGGGLPGPWLELRMEVEMSHRVLTPQTFEKARRLFLDHYAGSGPGALSPGDLTAEWQKEEFLLVVDENGSPPAPVKAVVERFTRTAEAHPAFRRWFRPVTLEEGPWQGAQTLAAARWLCHLIGLRHATVEIFIDPPHLPGHTLAQVRGMDKFEAPGAFDIPCAGHIDGVDSAEKSLEKELLEELNLNLSQLADLRLLGRYNSYSDDNAARQDARKINNEHRVLFRARLKPEAAAQIRFSDGEVAGLTVFAVGELRTLVRQYPERVASGLRDAIGFYE